MTSFRRLTRRSAAIPAALLVLGMLAIPAAADPSLEEVQERKARAAELAAQAEARGDTLAGRVAALDAMRAEAEAKVDALEAQLDRLDARIKDKQEQLTVAQKRMAVLTNELQDILSDLGSRTDVFVDRAVAAYKAGPTAGVEAVLSSGDFNDLIARYEYYQAALDTDSALLDEIENLRDGVEGRRIEVEQRQDEIAEAKIALLKDRAAIEVIYQERSAVLAEREQIVAEKESLLAEVRGRQRRYEQVVAQLEQDAAEIRALLASQGSSGGPFPTGGGQLLWPAAGTITSPFGYRTHPIFGDTRLHTGIDIGAGYGAPVIAADAGTVVFAGVMGGYGYSVVIDHGNGLGTTYNHMASVLVATGQGVARGSQVGAVGCSGYCTGPHLHFEVRVSANPVDPMPYLQ